MSQALLPSIERLREAFYYDGEEIYWRIRTSNRASIGAVAGTSVGSHGYRQIKLDGCLMLVHRVVWAISYGKWPTSLLDHADGNKKNNALSNLRAATQSLNNANAKVRSNAIMQLKGVTKIKGREKYVAQITVGGQKRYLGSFDSAAEAHIVYLKNAVSAFGQFARAS